MQKLFSFQVIDLGVTYKQDLELLFIEYIEILIKDSDIFFIS